MADTSPPAPLRDHQPRRAAPASPHQPRARSGVGGHFGDGIQQILLLEIGDLLLAANQINFGVAPVAAVLAGQYIGIHSLMSAMKRAKTKMNDTGISALRS